MALFLSLSDMPTNPAFLTKNLQNPETSLIDHLQLRNEKVFSLLYTAYSTALLSRIKRTVLSNLVAEEILHNVFLKIWLHINDYDAKKSSLFTWMISIARNESIDYLRSKQEKKNRVTISIDEKDVEPMTFINTEMDRFDLLKSLSSLPHKEQTILQLYRTGYTCREVSNILALPEGTVKTTMRRSFKKLRQILA